MKVEEVKFPRLGDHAMDHRSTPMGNYFLRRRYPGLLSLVAICTKLSGQ
jgi:hypothetical protein